MKLHQITHQNAALCPSLNSNSAPQKLNAPVKSTTSGFGALTSGFFQKNQVAKSFTKTSLSAGANAAQNPQSNRASDGAGKSPAGL